MLSEGLMDERGAEGARGLDDTQPDLWRKKKSQYFCGLPRVSGLIFIQKGWEKLPRVSANQAPSVTSQESLR